MRLLAAFHTKFNFYFRYIIAFNFEDVLVHVVKKIYELKTLSWNSEQLWAQNIGELYQWKHRKGKTRKINLVALFSGWGERLIPSLLSNSGCLHDLTVAFKVIASVLMLWLSLVFSLKSAGVTNFFLLAISLTQFVPSMYAYPLYVAFGSMFSS